jgi:hypothetical protein
MRLQNRHHHGLGGAGAAGPLRVTNSKPDAAIAQTAPHTPKVQSTPIIEAAVPIITLPRDHNPRSMKNKLNPDFSRRDYVEG